MSTDDIVFEGEVTYREPQKLRRPDRDRRFACIAYEVPGADDLPIFLDRKPADAIERHALRDTSVELGGILLGKECLDELTGEPFVWITEALEAKHFENTQASFTYTHDSWEEITRERDQKHPDLDIVGWYHTHPDFGIFLSGHDLFIHHHFFNQPLQVAYVVDPIRQTRGFFRWRDGQMEPVGGFFLATDRRERSALARLVNDLEGLPNPESGSGPGLSPRLEAELIAMLSRPHAPPSVDRGQTAAVFGMLGILVGALAVAGALWLGTISQGQKQLAVAVQEILKQRDKDAAAQDRALDAERVAAKEAALDILLRDLRIGQATGQAKDRVAARYTELIAQRDALRAEIEKLRTEKDALAAFESKLNTDFHSLESERDVIRKKFEKFEKESDAEKKELSEQVDQLKKDADYNAKLIKDTESGVLRRKYDWAWYAAVAGWGAFLLASLWLVSVLARGLPEEDLSTPHRIEPPMPPGPGREPPTHTIT